MVKHNNAGGFDSRQLSKNDNIIRYYFRVLIRYIKLSKTGLYSCLSNNIINTN